MSQTITQQKNKLPIENIVFQVQLEYKIFQKSKNAWPVQDLLVQYLCNSSQLEKKATSNLEKQIAQVKQRTMTAVKTYQKTGTTVTKTKTKTWHQSRENLQTYQPWKYIARHPSLVHVDHQAIVIDHNEHPSCPQHKEESEDEHGNESDKDDNLFVG
ncbi:hypothetical protein BKA82DRAFT_4013786 [Pisolithus tinctorius]|nr:hypothetical protein BKA82DRAFT_4013786 [Pisolithus tinctorius]